MSQDNERVFTDTMRDLAKGLYSNVAAAYCRDKFRSKHDSEMVNYLVDDVAKGYDNLFAIDYEGLLCRWACSGSEYIGDGLNTPTRAKTFEGLREEFAEMTAETIDDLASDGDELEDYQVKAKAMVEYWLDTSELGDFWFWFLSYYVEEKLVEWARDEALDVLNNSASNPASKAEEAFNEFCKAWIRLYDTTTEKE